MTTSQKLEVQEHINVIRELFLTFRENLRKIRNLKLPRCRWAKNSWHKWENILKEDLLVFSDAAGKKGQLGFYCVAAYHRVIYRPLPGTAENLVATQLSKACTKIAKLNYTLPKRELSSILEATQVATTAAEALGIPTTEVALYTDSNVSWNQIQNACDGQETLKTEVNNICEKILSDFPGDQFHFCPGHLNPADHGTRLADSTTESLLDGGSKWWELGESFHPLKPRFQHSKLELPKYDFSEEDNDRLINLETVNIINGVDELSEGTLFPQFLQYIHQK